MILLAGDSLAVGVHAALERPHVLRAAVGRRSPEGVRAIIRRHEPVVLVSLGANDGPAPAPFRRGVRRVLDGRSCVAWVTPPRRPTLAHVLRVEARRDPRLHVVGLGGLAHPDGVHSTARGYVRLAMRLSRACPPAER